MRLCVRRTGRRRLAQIPPNDTHMTSIINLLINTGAVLLSAYILPGVEVSGIGIGIIVAIALALINTYVQPVLLFLTLPINVATLGLFTFIINALLIMLAAAVIPGFRVKGFWWALLFAVILGIINSALFSILGRY